MMELEVTVWLQSYEIIRIAEMECLCDWSAVMDGYGLLIKGGIEDDSRSAGCKSTFSV